MKIIYVDGNKIEVSLFDSYIEASIQEPFISASIRENKLTYRMRDIEDPFIANIAYYISTYRVEYEDFESDEVYGFSEVDAYGTVFGKLIRS